eukprot:GHVQ01002832.1.p1 GENE.GHVQ01002832.1~~GHVQ01002832.1.p1  ORF type:complete len:806 (+),score=99.50 GHVQ01002832.1:455-2872(+)
MGNADSKFVVREHVAQLLSEQLTLEDEQYWNSLLGTVLSVDDIFELISPEDVRKLRNDRPLNACLLFKRIVFTLQHVIEEGTRGHISSAASDSSMTCVRLLTRIMPFILEHQNTDFVQALFWRPGGYVPAVQQEFKKQVSGSQKAEIVEHSGGDDPGGVTDDDSVVLGAELLVCLIRLLFLKGFCVGAEGVVIPEDEALPKHKVDARFLWKGGIGTSKDIVISTTTQCLKNRTEVLRCLLLCLSGSLYQTIDDYQQTIPVWLRLVTGGDLAYTANLFCSLMATVFNYSPVGYGMPYGALFSRADEEELVNVSTQLLVVLMDFNPSVFLQDTQGVSATDAPPSQMSQMSVDPKAVKRGSGGGHQSYEGGKSDGTPQNGVGGRPEKQDSGALPEPGVRNVFRTMLAGIKKEAEIDMIYDGFVRLLQTCPDSRNTYLPHSAQPIPFHQELLILLWHLITTNEVFLRRMTSRLNSNKLLVPLLYLLLDSSNSRKDWASGPSKVGLLHMCSFILLVLSSEREFAVRLNEPFIEKFPLDIPLFQGCHADLLALVTHRVVVDSTSSSANDSLIDMLLTVLCNISAYLKTFCLESCVKLLHLLDRFSRPAWLFKAPYHYHDVFFLLDMFNNIIQYQYEGNQKLVYSILRQKEIFTELQNIQYPARVQGGETNGSGTTATASPQSAGKDEKTNEEETPDKTDQWKPTPEWFNDWKSKLPLMTISRLITCLLPMVESECAEKSLVDQSEVLDFLQRTTMVGLLPVPHPIIIRNYQPNAYTALWFTSYMWGVIFSRSQNLAIFDWRKIKLIVINNR